MTTSHVSRRKVLAAGGAGTAGALLAAGVAFSGPAAGATPPPPPPPPPGAAGQGGGPNPLNEIVPWSGDHQAGITTAAPSRMQIAGFDLLVTSRAELVALLKVWQQAIAAMTTGQPVGPVPTPSQNPVDTGEAVGQPPAALTITIGFGTSLFDNRFGLAGLRPAALANLPAFNGDAIDLSRSNGDLSVQVCAERQLVVEHAVRMLMRLSAGKAKMRWLQAGFSDAPIAADSKTPRNMMGFKDGTANLRTDDVARMNNNVWVQPGDGPAWMTGGTYQVYRRVSIDTSKWDAETLSSQENTFGRRRASGAPFGAANEHDPVVSANLPVNSHVRLSNPRTGRSSEDERILRRGYNYQDAYNPTLGRNDVGLAFISYQRDPRRQFVPIQQRLAANDALNEYIQHNASGLFAVPPGAKPGSYPGQGLFAAAGGPS